MKSENSFGFKCLEAALAKEHEISKDRDATEAFLFESKTELLPNDQRVTDSFYCIDTAS